MNGLASTGMGSNLASSLDRINNANSLFSMSMNQGKRTGFFKKLMGRSNKLTALSLANGSIQPGQQRHHGVVNVPLDKIVGSEGRSDDFDQEFRPLVKHLRERWTGIAIAHGRGKVLPPVELIQVGQQYFVRDGHHRISVAKAFGQASIEAEIVN